MHVWLERAHDRYDYKYNYHQAFEALDWSTLLLVWTENEAVQDAQAKGEAKAAAQGEVVERERLTVLALLLVSKELGLWQELESKDRPLVCPLDEVVDCVLAQNEPNGRLKHHAQDVQVFSKTYCC